MGYGIAPDRLFLEVYGLALVILLNSRNDGVSSFASVRISGVLSQSSGRVVSCGARSLPHMN